MQHSHFELKWSSSRETILVRSNQGSNNRIYWGAARLTVNLEGYESIEKGRDSHVGRHTSQRRKPVKLLKNSIGSYASQPSTGSHYEGSSHWSPC